MEFSYYELKEWAQNGNSIGNWNGYPVFICSCNDLINMDSGAYYILYDDENKIVKNKHDEWYVYGIVRKNGSVDEYSSARKYHIVEAASTPTYTPGYDKTERPVGDVKCEIDVETILKKARELSINDLLEGFLLGVNYDVEKR